MSNFEQLAMDLETVSGPDSDVKGDIRCKLSRTRSKREEYRRAQKKRTPKQTVKEAVGKIELPERMRTIKEILGFLPVSTLETTQAFGLLDKLGKPTSTVSYLNEILKHQMREKVKIDNPERTPIHVVLDFANHRDDAVMSGIILRSLHESLTDVLNPRLTLDVVEDEIPAELYVPALRHKVIETAVFDDKLTSGELGSVLATDFMVDPIEGSFDDLLTNFLRKTTIKEARDITAVSIGEQGVRAEFWDYRVQEAGNHYAVRPAVSRLTR